jgi:O-antigen ligase
MDIYTGGDIIVGFTNRFLNDSGALSFGKNLLILFLAICKSHADTISIFIALIFLIIYLAQRYHGKIKWMALIFALVIPVYFGMDIYFGGPIRGKFTDFFSSDKPVVQPSDGASLIQANNKTFFDEMIIKYGHYAGYRFYIYLRAMEQRFKSRFLFGTGPDTFAFFFPQDDEYKTQYGAVPKNELVDKMHSMFLQIWFNTGFVSFASFILMLLLHFANSVKILWSLRAQTYIEVLGLGFFLGWVGFLGAALFNDSVISVSPYFWAFFGASIAANHVIRSPKPVFSGSSVPATKPQH